MFPQKGLNGSIILTVSKQTLGCPYVQYCILSHKMQCHWRAILNDKDTPAKRAWACVPPLLRSIALWSKYELSSPMGPFYRTSLWGSIIPGPMDVISGYRTCFTQWRVRGREGYPSGIRVSVWFSLCPSPNRSCSQMQAQPVRTVWGRAETQPGWPLNVEKKLLVPQWDSEFKTRQSLE